MFVVVVDFNWECRGIQVEIHITAVGSWARLVTLGLTGKADSIKIQRFSE